MNKNVVVVFVDDKSRDERRRATDNAVPKRRKSSQSIGWMDERTYGFCRQAEKRLETMQWSRSSNPDIVVVVVVSDDSGNALRV